MGSMLSAPEANGKKDDMADLLAALPAENLEPLWPKMDVMVPATPNPKATPFIWKNKDTLPHLLRAGEIVPAESAERRVLMLVNPTMSSSLFPLVFCCPLPHYLHCSGHSKSRIRVCQKKKKKKKDAGKEGE